MSRPTYDELEAMYRDALKTIAHERQRAELLEQRLKPKPPAYPAAGAIVRRPDGVLARVRPSLVPSNES